MIAIIDYGMGNLRSVQKALEIAGARTFITQDASDLANCDKIVLPGVGAFNDAMRELRKRSLDIAIKDSINRGTPFLGLCLGLQLLFEKSEEAPGVKGLSVFKGEVRRFKFKRPRAVKLSASEGTRGILKVPHMGWNVINIDKSRKAAKKILKDIKDGSFVYFVHSYYVKPKDKSIVLTTTDYGQEFVSSVAVENIYGLQFHPEKSQCTGLKMLKNFVTLC